MPAHNASTKASLVSITAFVLVAAPAAGQTVRGIAWDGTSGRPVPGAVLHVRSASGEDVGHPGAVADSAGRFTLNLRGVRLPAAVVAQRQGYAASAPFFLEDGSGTAGVEILVELRSLGAVEEPVALTDAGTSPDRLARILGWVKEKNSGRPVYAAEVTVLGSERSATTDVNGMFILDGVPPGPISVGITHMSFAPEGRAFTAEAGRSYEIRASLAPDAIPLQGVEVSVRSSTWYRQMDGLRVRMQLGLRGDFITAQHMEARGFPPVAEALRELPGVRLIRADPHAWDVRFRNCEQQPVLYIDGIQVNQPESGEPLRELVMVHGMDVEAIEVYRGAASVPAEFSGPDAMCGAIVIWTRRGG